MSLSTRTGIVFYAIALIAWGTLHIISGEFVAGRAPVWPVWLPGKLFFGYSSGLLLILSGVAIIVRQQAKLAGVCAGILILLWAGLRNMYELLTTLDYGFILTTTNKALSIGFGALLIASTINDDKSPALAKSSIDKITETLAPLAPFFVGFFLFASGIQHFLFVDFVKSLVPASIPAAVFWTYFSAVALIAAGVGLITGIKRKLAATLSAWMIFTWLIILHLPRALGANSNFNEWTSVFEALAFSGLLFIISHQVKKSQVKRSMAFSSK
jgi:uncharacterized membrane protein